MQHTTRIGFVLAGMLTAALLVTGGVQAAPARRARPHATQTHATITAAQAKSIALKRFPGKVVGKTPLENEEGTWQYGVMVQSGKTLREVMVNAKTGKIDSVEVTTAGKEKTEAKAEQAKAHAKAAPKAKPMKPAAPAKSK